MNNPKTTEERSRIMSSIRAVSKLETLVTTESWRRGYRFRRNLKSLNETPTSPLKDTN